ncbi:MAG: HAD-IIIA family hydrolase [Synergistaceae bacterium]
MIKLFVLDVDGTLTDGGFYLDGNGTEFKKFNVQDGYGIVSLIKTGVDVVFLSGRYSKSTEQRAQELKVTHCVNGVEDKLNFLKKYLEKEKILFDEVLYIGDDIPDIECIKYSKFGVAPSNAVKDVKLIADWITVATGGNGAVRECCDFILNYNKGTE